MVNVVEGSLDVVDHGVPVAPRPAGRHPRVPEVANLVVGEAGVADVLGHCRAGKRRKRPLSALRAPTKAPQKVD